MWFSLWRCLLATLALTSPLAILSAAASNHPNAPSPGSGGSSRPNVLFIAVDDLRPEIAGPYQQSGVHTPNIVRLAARGTTMMRAYCQVSLCSPSRTSLLTGLRPDTTKLWTIGPFFRETMGAEEGGNVVTLPQYFKQHGYNVTGAGKVFHPGTSSGGPSLTEGGADGGYPFHQNGSWSFPYFFCDQFHNGTFQSPAMQQWPGSDAKGCVQSPSCVKCLVDAGSVTPTGKPAWSAAPCPDNCYPDGAVADEIVRQLASYGELAKANGGELEAPFFLAAGFKRPHLGYFGPQQYFDLYQNASVPLAKHRSPPQDMPAVAFGNNNGEMCGMDGVTCEVSKAGFKLVPDHQHVELRKAYYSVVSFMDAQLGRVLDALDASDLANNTMIILWGDHGYQLGEHGVWAKLTNFELGTRVPLIISLPVSIFPAAAKGGSSNALVEFLDVYPTLVEAAGLPSRGAALQGRSLLHLLVPGHPAPIAAASFNASFSQISRSGNIMGISMRTDRYRYTEWLPFNSTQGQPLFQKNATDPELYEHSGDDEADFDRFENINLAADPAHAVLVQSMHDSLVWAWDRDSL